MENSMHPLAEITLFGMWVPALIAGSWLIAKLLNGGFKATCAIGTTLMMFLAVYMAWNPNEEKQASDDLILALCVTALILTVAAVGKMIVENTRRKPQPQPLPVNVRYPRPRDQR